MKKIILTHNIPKNNNNNNKPIKIREKINNLKIDISNCINNYEQQIIMINKLYMGVDFNEKKFVLSELKNKINSYKSQDYKKEFILDTNLINLDSLIEKLVCCKLKCYYCNNKMLVLFDKVRDDDQWTLDRLNNLDEHSSQNTIISCLKCNLQRRRKNSEKFKFTKQLQTNQIIIKKIE